MRSIAVALTLAVCLPVFLIGQSASGSEKIIEFPAPQATSPQQLKVPHLTFKDIRPSGPPIVFEVSSGTLLYLQDAVRYAFIADSEVADIQVEQEQPKLIYVTAKKTGKTVLYAIDNMGRVLLNKVIEVSSPPAPIPPAPIPPVAIIRRAKLEYTKSDNAKLNSTEPVPPEQSPVVPLQTAPSESP